MKKVTLVCAFVLLTGCGNVDLNSETVSQSLSNEKSISIDFPREEKTHAIDPLAIGTICNWRGASVDEQATCTEMQWPQPTVLCGAYDEGQPCEDYNPCTFADVCHNGVCAGNWYTYCIPCRRDNDCCGPAFCAGDPTDNYARGHAIVTTGLCIAGRCEQRAETCANGCAHPNGCF